MSLVLVSAVEAAWFFRVSTASVYRWVSLDGLAAYGPRHNRRYDFRELQGAFDRRRSPLPSVRSGVGVPVLTNR